MSHSEANQLVPISINRLREANKKQWTHAFCEMHNHAAFNKHFCRLLCVHWGWTHTERIRTTRLASGDGSSNVV